MLMAPKLTKNLLALATIHIQHTGGALSTLSKHAHSDSVFFDRLSRGECSFSVRKYDQIVCWFATHWPEGARWPAGVGIPTRREAREIEQERASA
jgi:hypothetical protein